MASWLSAGSGGSGGSDDGGFEDGTVVRRASVAGAPPAVNINSAYLFSPSKLESIFTPKDDSQHTNSNETFSFIPPSPTKVSPTKMPHESSELPSDLSQGTSIAVHPKTKRASLGTGDYLSEASKVMNLLRGTQERKRSTLRRHPSASITPSEMYEGPEHKWLTPTEPEDISLHLDPLPALDENGNDIEISDESLTPAHADEYEEQHQEQRRDDTERSIPESLQSGSSTRRPTSVIRSPSKSVNWVENMSARFPSSVYESDEDNYTHQSAPVRSVSKRVDWADAMLSPRPPSPMCETQLDEADAYSRITTLPNTPIRSPRHDLSLSRSRPSALREVSANVAKPLVSFKSSGSSRQISEQHLRRFSESQIMRLPPRPAAPTPPMSRHTSMMIRRTPQLGEVSILDLTPLADFTMHDREPGHHERSFVDDRAHPRALRQAHGTLALARDALIQAITDVQTSELFWERTRYLRLDKKELKSLHSLDDFCPNLDQLSVAENQITHLNSVPSTLRALDISNNLLTDTISWSGLRNLQYLDVSGNKNLENLDGFGDLIHLRTLKANECSIRNIGGVLQHNGLLELELRGNRLEYIDFAGSQLDQLKRLDLSNNKLEQLVNLNFLRKLLDLDVSHNSLRQILPPTRRGPKLLSELGAANNKLKTFNFQQFPALKCAFLDNNAIDQIKGLAKATKLETLSIRHQDSQNDLVDQVLCTPNDCRSLALSGNAITDGVLELPNLPQHSLLELELAECGIKELGFGFGNLFPNLRNLNLNHNAIHELSDLQGMFRLTRLVLVRNRVRRMRRTCLLLARLPLIHEVDLRDNPLTMGFHPPVKNAGTSAEARFKANVKWRSTFDDNTAMRRRLTEIMLGEHCKNLSILDGLTFNREVVLQKEEIWQKCEDKGVVAAIESEES